MAKSETCGLYHTQAMHSADEGKVVFEAHHGKLLLPCTPITRVWLLSNTGAGVYVVHTAIIPRAVYKTVQTHVLSCF